MDRTVILTVVGSDRPGLTRAIADAVYATGGNWLESHLSRLGGKYVGSVLVELPEERLAELEKAARGIDAFGIKVDIIGFAKTDERTGQSLTIEIVGQDRPGIVREVTVRPTDGLVADLLSGRPKGTKQRVDHSCRGQFPILCAS